MSQCSTVNLKDPAAQPKTFTFDGTYYTDSTTEQIYNEIAYPLVEVRKLNILTILSKSERIEDKLWCQSCPLSAYHIFS